MSAGLAAAVAARCCFSADGRRRSRQTSSTGSWTSFDGRRCTDAQPTYRWRSYLMQLAGCSTLRRHRSDGALPCLRLRLSYGSVGAARPDAAAAALHCSESRQD